MKSYPELYSRTSTGAVQTWMMEVSGNKYRTTSGQVDGVKTTTEWTTAKPKNEGRANATTGEEQAQAEVEAKYTKKLKEGYHKSISDIDTKTYFEPMLAHKWDDRKEEVDWSRGNYVSPKMDGLRTVFTKSGATSRNGRPFTSFPHILSELLPVFKKYPDLILDGEIYASKLSDNFEKIVSLAKKSKPTAEDLKESKQFIEYWIFDFPSLGGSFHERFSKGKEMIETALKGNRWIKVCPHTLVKNPEDIETYLQKFLEEGYEGLMLNTYFGKYEQKRSKEILKYKLFQDMECEIVSITEGEGNRSGMFGYATLKMPNGKTFDASARGSAEFYQRLLRDKKKLAGKQATVRYQNLTTENKVPRFPVIVAIRDYE